MPNEIPELDISMKAEDVIKGAVIRFSIIETNNYRIRKWIAIQLIRLGVWVLGCQIEIEDE